MIHPNPDMGNDIGKAATSVFMQNSGFSIAHPADSVIYALSPCMDGYNGTT